LILLTVVFLLLGILLIVLQTSVLQMLPGEFARPDLVYLLVAFAAYRLPWLPGILLAFTVGWILDVLVGVNLGVYPLQFLLVFVCLKFATLNSPVKESAYQIPMIGVSYFLLKMLSYIVSSMTIQYERLPEWSWVGIIQQTLLLVIAAIPCFLLFNCLYEYLLTRAARSRPARRRVRKHL
jgi:rod shape-determining protein MreD